MQGARPPPLNPPLQTRVNRGGGFDVPTRSVRQGGRSLRRRVSGDSSHGERRPADDFERVLYLGGTFGVDLGFNVPSLTTGAEIRRRLPVKETPRRVGFGDREHLEGSRFFNFAMPSAATPEPISALLLMSGIAIVARRVRRRSSER
jgi:hypothetical protein